MKSEQINELATALSKAQGEIKAATKDSNNPFFKSKYSDLNSVWAACREPLSKNGLSITQIPYQTETESNLYTLLMHESGQWIESKMALKIKSTEKSNDLQALGSAISYLRRYALMAIVGIAPGDEDDGNGAGGYQAPTITQPEPPKVEMITQFQVEQLKAEIETCSTDFKNNISAWMGKANINSYEGLSKMQFLNILQNAVQENSRLKAQSKEVAQ